MGGTQPIPLDVRVVSATAKDLKAAVEEGIVPGGGVALLRTIGALDKLLKTEKDEDIAIGIRIVNAYGMT